MFFNEMTSYLYATIFIFHFAEIFISSIYFYWWLLMAFASLGSGLFLVAAFAAINQPSPASVLCLFHVFECLERGTPFFLRVQAFCSLERCHSWHFMAVFSEALPLTGASSALGGNVKWKDMMLISHRHLPHQVSGVGAQIKGAFSG